MAVIHDVSHITTHPLTQLARIRLNLGLSQAELAIRAGFKQQYVSLLERGMRPTDESHVVKLAEVLGVEAEALFAESLTICTSPSGEVSVNSVADGRRL
jgi:transcriptional regulator with XRE-family HTH domain